MRDRLVARGGFPAFKSGFIFFFGSSRNQQLIDRHSLCLADVRLFRRLNGDRNAISRRPSEDVNSDFGLRHIFIFHAHDIRRRFDAMKFKTAVEVRELFVHDLARTQQLYSRRFGQVAARTDTHFTVDIDCKERRWDDEKYNDETERPMKHWSAGYTSKQEFGSTSFSGKKRRPEDRRFVGRAQNSSLSATRA